MRILGIKNNDDYMRDPIKILENYLNLYHPRYKVEDLEIADTPGYWRSKAPCKGVSDDCYEPMHDLIGYDEGVNHTISYFDSLRDNKGRFSSPTRTWQAIKNKLNNVDYMGVV